MRAETGKIEAAAFAPHQQKGDHNQHRSGVGDKKVEHASVDRRFILPGNDQKPGRQRHHFKQHDEPKSVVHHQQGNHRCDEKIHKEAHRRRAFTLVFAHISQ